MANYVSNETEEGAVTGTLPADEVTNEATSSVKDTVEEVAEKGTKLLVDALDEVLSPTAIDNVEAGAAFAAAVIDGWSFGTARSLIGWVAPDVGAELDRLREENPGFSTGGDIVAFITPAAAAKLWVGAIRLGAKAIARHAVSVGVKNTPEHADELVSTFTKYAKRGVIKTPAKYKRGWKAILQTGYGKELRENAALFMRQLIAESTTDGTIDKGLKLIKRQTGLDPADAIQCWMAYNGVKKAYLAGGRSEEEAHQQGLFAAFAILAPGKIARGFSETHLARWLGKVEEGGSAQFGFIKKLAVEWGIPLSIFNLGKIEEVLQTAGTIAKEGADIVRDVYESYTDEDAAAARGYKDGGLVYRKDGGSLDKKVSLIYKEGYKAPGQAYAIAKSMGYEDGGPVIQSSISIVGRTLWQIVKYEGIRNLALSVWEVVKEFYQDKVKEAVIEYVEEYVTDNFKKLKEMYLDDLVRIVRDKFDSVDSGDDNAQLTPTVTQYPNRGGLIAK